MNKAIPVGIAVLALGLGAVTVAAASSPAASHLRMTRANSTAAPADPAGDQGQTGEKDTVGETGDQGPKGEADQANQTGDQGQMGEKDQSSAAPTK